MYRWRICWGGLYMIVVADTVIEALNLYAKIYRIGRLSAIREIYSVERIGACNANTSSH
jgi:hypothetical protein